MGGREAVFLGVTNPSEVEGPASLAAAIPSEVEGPASSAAGAAAGSAGAGKGEVKVGSDISTL